MEGALDIKQFVNQIFAQKGLPKVKNFPAEFADGSKLMPQILKYFFLMPYILN